MASRMKQLLQGSGRASSVALKRPRTSAICLFALAVLFALIFCPSDHKPKVSQPLAQQVYVWQRSWSPAVKSAVRQRGAEFDQVVVLAAEITWNNGAGKAAHVKLDGDALRKINRPIGIAMRVNPFEGPKSINPFDPAGSQTRFICDLAAETIDRATRESINPVELQIDFDCPESKLAGYRNWVAAIKQRIAPTALCITTLPSLINAPGFAPLVRECDSYVLQVHSMKRPASPDQVQPLCDAVQARKWVQTASRIGVPFRVALPTYAYVAQFDARGNCVRLTAEGSNTHPPAGGSSREIRSDADAIAQLVREWNTHQPSAMKGLIWYRLPTEDDDYNWRWQTLAAVMQGRAPKSDAQVSVAPMLEQH
jgi:uncharacterized protein DUF3142